MLSQAILLFPCPFFKCCPSLTGGLLAGHGVCLGEQWVAAASGVHGAHLQMHLHVLCLTLQDKALLKAGLGSHRHGMWGHVGAWEQPGDHHCSTLLVAPLLVNI